MGIYATLTSSPTMIAVTVIVLVMEMLSLLFFALTVRQFQQHEEMRQQFFSAIRYRTTDQEQRRHLLILWMYMLSTLAVTLVTAGLFLFQPHLI